VNDTSIEIEWVENYTGCAVRGNSHHSQRSDHRDGDHEEVNVVLEGYLKISALLSDILDRRKKLIRRSTHSDRNIDDWHSVQLPNYFYNLISFESGRSAKLVIVFDNPQFIKIKKEEVSRKREVPAAYGVIVKLDLFDHSYTELKWLQHPSCNGAEFLRRWSNSLASNDRMMEMYVGPYCVSSSKDFFVIKTHEHEINDHDDGNAEMWNPFVVCKLRGNWIMPPKEVAMSSLYPGCDIINNNAVTSGRPIRFISCKDFPLHLSYR
jgi:hypothetical protein